MKMMQGNRDEIIVKNKSTKQELNQNGENN